MAPVYVRECLVVDSILPSTGFRGILRFSWRALCSVVSYQLSDVRRLSLALGQQGVDASSRINLRGRIISNGHSQRGGVILV